MAATRSASVALPERISFRLNALLVVLVTSLLAVSGTFVYWQTSARLEEEARAARAGVQARLQRNLQSAVWNLDAPLLDHILAAELVEPVTSITVQDQNGTVLGLRKTDATPANLSRFDFPLVYTQSGLRQPIGRVTVGWSGDAMARTLQSQARWRVADILILDLALVGVIWISLRLLVFRRVERLRDALRRTAEGEGSAEQFALRIERADELGAVASQFNRIAQRLSEDLAERRRAEREARESYDSLKLTQEALLQSEKLAALGRLVAGVAHELNTPIGNALLAATASRDQADDFAREVASGQLRRSRVAAHVEHTRQAGEILVRNLDKAAHLILSFKQVAADQASSQRRSFALREVLDEVLLAHHPMLKKSPIEISSDVPESIRLDSYPGPLGQVLGNLIVNAVLHGYEGRSRGAVRVSARLDGADTVEIAVRDEGRGITDADLKKIFEPFFTTRLGRGGTGLGLAICHRIATEALGGTLRVSSRLEQGTTFILRIPLKAPALAAKEAA